jgi:hypothetical protein
MLDVAYIGFFYVLNFTDLKFRVVWFHFIIVIVIVKVRFVSISRKTSATYLLAKCIGSGILVPFNFSTSFIRKSNFDVCAYLNRAFNTSFLTRVSRAGLLESTCWVGGARVRLRSTYLSSIA